jgi:hypothetical protein
VIMKRILFVLLGLAMTVPSMASAEDCYPEYAPYCSYNWYVVAGERYYVEERNSPQCLLGAPVPGAGTVSGGTWIYQESNGIAGLQRGGVGYLGDYFPPACDLNWELYPQHGTYPCLITQWDYINDENCGNGPDTLIMSTRLL